MVHSHHEYDISIKQDIGDDVDFRRLTYISGQLIARLYEIFVDLFVAFWGKAESTMKVKIYQ